jgi:hypothetical protein
VAVGMPVEVFFDAADDLSLPFWRPASGGPHRTRRRSEPLRDGSTPSSWRAPAPPGAPTGRRRCRWR